MFWVKICGIATAEAALAAAGHGASAVGFILTSGFRRTVAPELARAIIGQLPPSLHKVGVFVDEPVERINELADFCGLTMVQLHGQEPADCLPRLRRPAIKAIRLEQPADAARAAAYAGARALLLEPHVPGTSGGGLGTALDLTLVPAVRRQLPPPAAGEPGPRVFLAGGLNPENVAAAIAAAAPDGVDVSSGVETGGDKDLSKIAAFIAAARRQST